MRYRLRVLVLTNHGLLTPESGRRSVTMTVTHHLPRLLSTVCPEKINPCRQICLTPIQFLKGVNGREYKLSRKPLILARGFSLCIWGTFPTGRCINLDKSFRVIP